MNLPKFIRWEEKPGKINLNIKVSQLLPFSKDNRHVITLAHIERPGNYYRCYVFDKTWKEYDLQTAKFNIMKLIAWLFKNTEDTLKFEGLIEHPDLWKFCK